MSHFRSINRDIDALLPPAVQDWLPEGHLARDVVEVAEGLDLRALEQAYSGRGSLPYHPATLRSLLIDCYATGCSSSRKIERATDDSLAFRFIAANSHPDHDTLSTFRRRFAKEFKGAFVQVLQVARENRLGRFGTVSLDGTKIHADASRHSALSYGHAEAIEAQLKGEVQELAEEADAANLPDGLRQCRHRAGDRDQTRRIPPPLVGALHEPRSPARRGDPGGAHDPPPEDPQRPGGLRPAQANRRAGLRHHQSSLEVVPLLRGFLDQIDYDRDVEKDAGNRPLRNP